MGLYPFGDGLSTTAFDNKTCIVPPFPNLTLDMDSPQCLPHLQRIYPIYSASSSSDPIFPASISANRPSIFRRLTTPESIFFQSSSKSAISSSKNPFYYVLKAFQKLKDAGLPDYGKYHSKTDNLNQLINIVLQSRCITYSQNKLPDKISQ